MDANQLLKTLIEKYEFIDGIILSDRDGIEIYSCFKEDANKLKENQISQMLAAAIQQTNDNLQKLNQTRLQQMMLFYDNCFVLISQWNSLILSIYSQLDCNQSLIQQISEDLKITFASLADEVDKINQQK